MHILTAFPFFPVFFLKGPPSLLYLAGGLRCNFRQYFKKPASLEPVPLAKVSGQGWKSWSFKDGERAFSNRDYVWQGVPDRLLGWDFTQGAGGDWHNVTIAVIAATAGDVFIATTLSESEPCLASAGWKLRKDADLASLYYTDS